MKLSLFLVFSVALLLIQCQYAKCQEGGEEEPTTKKPGFFSRLFGKGSSTTTTTTTTTTTPRNLPALIPRRPNNPPMQPNPSDPFGSANMGLGPIPPYQRPKQQPSGLSLSYGPTGRPGMQPGYSAPLAPMGPLPSSPTPASPLASSQPPMSPTPVSGVNQPGSRPLFPQSGGSPIPTAVVPSTTTTLKPKAAFPQAPLAKVDEFDDFDNHKKPALPAAPSTTTTTTTRKPTPKEDFPALPAPRRPSIKEDFPGLPSRPTSPGGQSPTPSSPSAWSTTPSSPGNRVAFVPHIPAATTTVKPGMPTTEKPLATDDEIRELTETLYTKETNSQLNLINVNIQGKTRSIDSTDEAPQALLQVNDKALEPQTIAKMRALFNNYELDTTVNEYVTPMEKKEENDFVDAVMATNVMRQAMLFLQNKGIVTPDPKTHRDLVKTLWFTPYSRGQGKIGSSGFEHVFVNEVKNGTIIGLHNWVYFNEEEKAGRLDYKGYLNKLDLGNKGMVVKTRFTHNGLNKPVNTLFIGTSPELELALYTICHQVRTDRSCPVSLGGNKFGIQTYSWRYRGKNLIGSAYPEI